ncbi:hypothetical protein C8J56DRAFT_864712 [Mycena floridula]|nr:hypothetical protein C8J56DRAFT_864712 [Mycena floridula]
MSPRGPSSSTVTSSSARSSSAPYSRRTSSQQPKSTRQQFSACGACRMRRVRCDLKDLPIAAAGPHPSCSNCTERGLKCVDEFADVKAVKLLRRGRRLQQVEAIYGKVTDHDEDAFSAPASRVSSIIPQLHPDFFSSSFWRWFSIQRPILDPNEFPARYIAHSKGQQSLGHEGAILAMILVVWAASFGLDECGVPDDDGSSLATGSSVDPETNRITRQVSRPDRTSHSTDSFSRDRARRSRKEKTETMLREVLELVDFHGVLRRPSWDGCRVLLLLLPLLDDTQNLERLVMYESTLSQAHSICTFVPGPTHPLPSSDDSVVRARIFWYAHLQEGITTAMRGGRLVLSEDDLNNFQSTLHSFNVNTSSGLPSPVSSSFSSNHSDLSGPSSGLPASHPYLHITHLFSIPLRLGAVCRKVHAVLTGIKAVRRIEQSSALNVDARGLHDIWERLDRCWEEFEGVRRGGLANGDVDPMVDRFVSAWQIFIFECHNIIREALKQYAQSSPTGSPTPGFSSASSTHMNSHSPPPLSSASYLFGLATRECLRLLPPILTTINRHLSLQVDPDPMDIAGIFRWDSGLVRDGVFFAGYLSASLSDDACFMHSRRSYHILSGSICSAAEGVAVCLGAIGEMRWAFSKSDEREENIRRLWEENELRRQQGQVQFGHSRSESSHITNEMNFGQHVQPHSNTFEHPIYTADGKISHTAQPSLAPISIVPVSTRVESAPTTACSTDSSAHGWPSYTPPGTGTSSTSGTNPSTAGSPSSFPSLGHAQGFKADGDDTFYHHVGGELDQFTFSGPVGAYQHHQQQPRSSAGTPQLHAPNGEAPTPSYIDFSVGSNAPSGISMDDIQSCSQFGEDCTSGFYH